MPAFRSTLVYIGVALSFGTAEATTVYDATAQFDLTNNPSAVGGWSYGYTSALGGAFTLFTARPNPPSFFDWALPTSFYPDIEKNISGHDVVDAQNGGFFPKDSISLSAGSNAPNGTYAVLRWTTPASGSYIVESIFTGVWDHADSHGDVHVLLNGLSVFDGSIDHQSSTSYVGSIALQAGTTVDFVLGHAPWARSIIDARISPVPEPAMYALWLVGISIVGLKLVRRSLFERPFATTR